MPCLGGRVVWRQLDGPEGAISLHDLRRHAHSDAQAEVREVVDWLLDSEPGRRCASTMFTPDGSVTCEALRVAAQP